MTLAIRLTDSPDDHMRRAIVGPLLAYNAQQTATTDFKPVAAMLEDTDGVLVGGLWGRTAYGWLFVELLFVPESHRGQGLGRQLMQRVEQEALSRGCHNAWLDTFEFQARGFYERLGYQCFGELADYPPGFSRYFMRKTLRPAPVAPAG